MARLSDDALRHIIRQAQDDLNGTSADMAERMARELLAARKVVEAARNLQKCERDLFIGSAGMLNVREASLRLGAALASLEKLEQ